MSDQQLDSLKMEFRTSFIDSGQGCSSKVEYHLHGQTVLGSCAGKVAEDSCWRAAEGVDKTELNKLTTWLVASPVTRQQSYPTFQA